MTQHGGEEPSVQRRYFVQQDDQDDTAGQQARDPHRIPAGAEASRKPDSNAEVSQSSTRTTRPSGRDRESTVAGTRARRARDCRGERSARRRGRATRGRSGTRSSMMRGNGAPCLECTAMPAAAAPAAVQATLRRIAERDLPLRKAVCSGPRPSTRHSRSRTAGTRSARGGTDTPSSASPRPRRSAPTRLETRGHTGRSGTP